MSNRTIAVDDRLYDYLCEVSLRETELMRRLREETRVLPKARMQISPEQGQFMALLVRLIGAEWIIEIGTFTGYSALCMASMLPPTGRLVTCDIDAEWTAVAHRYWTEAGVADRINLKLAPALDTLDQLIAGGGAGHFDFGFIDAERENHKNYFERVMALLRPGGLVAVDNVLWGGRVADPDNRDTDTEAIRAFNKALHGDARIDLSLVPIGDGLTLAHKR